MQENTTESYQEDTRRPQDKEHRAQTKQISNWAVHSEYSGSPETAGATSIREHQSPLAIMRCLASVLQLKSRLPQISQDPRPWMLKHTCECARPSSSTSVLVKPWMGLFWSSQISTQADFQLLYKQPTNIIPTGSADPSKLQCLSLEHRPRL